ncbi:BatD family protein [Shewanella dokdonensis]|uniref:BatD family protein n=1 Tax=Shewanella dokdonensis TaxID=712036 RepID=UPI00200E676D|nr:BatD family protein [Shewanella dokdonensis]
MVKLRFPLWLLLATLLPLKALALTELQASVDKNPVPQGEYIALTVTADDDLQSQALDTSALLKDFIVGRTSVGRSTQIINFDTRKETRWQILIAPKQLGQVTIPAFDINGVKSNPIQLQVVDSSSQPQQMKNLFLRTSISSDEAYVGQLLTYKVKLYLAVDLQRGVLSTPNIEGAQIKQIGDDKDSNEIVNGRRYRVIERTYSIIADNPGKLMINGVNFSGDVLMNSPSSGMFSFQESRPVQAQGDSLVVSINPIPKSYVGDWLVADLVALQEDWKDNQSYEAGQPITRNITLLASNADETSLPDLHLSLPADMRSYPDKPVKKTYVRNGQTVAKLTQTIAIVPAKAGDYTLPEIKVAWWNPHLNQEEYATLPARQVKVKPASNTPAPDLSTPVAQAQNNNGYWPLATAVFAGLWLLTLLLWWWTSQQNSKRVTTVESKKERPVVKADSLDDAIKANNIGEVLNALLHELSLRSSHKVTLQNLAEISPALAQTVTALQAAHYGRKPTDTAELYQTLKTQLAAFNTGTKQQRDSALMSLNP